MSSWSWSYSSWIYNYMYIKFLWLLKLFEHRSWRHVPDTTLCDKVCHWLSVGRWFSPGTPVSSINKTDRHNITEIFLKDALNTINLNLVLIAKLLQHINEQWADLTGDGCPGLFEYPIYFWITTGTIQTQDP